MFWFRSAGRRNSFVRLLVALTFLQPASTRADVPGDEDETKYEVVIEPSFRDFRRKYGRYPTNWIELGVQSSCSGYDINERKNFPKPTEKFIWRPRDCELSYKLVFGNRNGFRVVALAKGHVVSVYENFKATYYKTPYHDHGPYGQNPPEGTVY